MKIPNKTAAAQ